MEVIEQAPVVDFTRSAVAPPPSKKTKKRKIEPSEKPPKKKKQKITPVEAEGSSTNTLCLTP